MDSARMCYTQRNSDDERGGVRNVKALSKSECVRQSLIPRPRRASGQLMVCCEDA